MVTFLMTLYTLGASASPSHVSEPAPDPRRWMQEISDEVLLQSSGIIKNFTIEQPTWNEKQKWMRITSELSGIGFLQYFDESYLSFGSHLLATDAAHPSHNQILTMAPIQLVFIDQGTNMALLKRGSAGLVPAGSWAISDKDRRNSSAFLAWISHNLAYDAVVLDQKSEYILAALLQKRTELGQGLLLNNTAFSWYLNLAQHKVGTLLQMVRMEGELAVFEMLYDETSYGQIMPGTKIILGQSENVKRMKQTGGD